MVTTRRGTGSTALLRGLTGGSGEIGCHLSKKPGDGTHVVVMGAERGEPGSAMLIVFGSATPSSEPWWTGSISPAYVDAHCALDLGQFTVAERHATTALDAHNPGHVRRRAMGGLLLARIHAAAGDTAVACQAGAAAGVLIARLASRRTLGELRLLTGALTPARDRQHVQHFLDQARTLLAAAAWHCVRMDRAPQLVLWDIDRTLIYAGGVDKQVWLEVCAELTGVPVSVPEATSGRTEPDILFDILCSGAGVDAARARALLPEALRREGELFARRTDQLAAHGRVLPGARAALEALSRIPAVTQTVVTGNVRANAETKLRVLGLAPFIDFPIGGYGSDCADRAELVRLARTRSSEARHVNFTAESTVVVGDSARDILAAHTAGAWAVAVATGLVPAAELQQAGPDVLLPDLRDTASVLDAILTRP